MLFIGHFGGLLGLCFGFSLINVVEIIYFFTFRLYQHLSNKSKHQNNAELDKDGNLCQIYASDFKMGNSKIFQPTFHSQFREFIPSKYRNKF